MEDYRIQKRAIPWNLSNTSKKPGRPRENDKIFLERFEG